MSSVTRQLKQQGVSLLYFMGLLDVLALVAATVLVVQMPVQTVGYEVKLPLGGNKQAIDPNGLFLHVSGSMTNPVYALGDQIVTTEQLQKELSHHADENAQSVIYVGINEDFPIAVQSQIFQYCQEVGLRCVLLGKKETAPAEEGSENDG